MNKILTLAFIFTLILSSCKKYDDGPSLSFRSKKERLANTWVFESVVNSAGEVETADYALWELTLDKKGDALITYRFSTITNTEDATWSFESSKTRLKIDYSTSLITSLFPKEYIIKKLKEKDMVLESEDGRTFTLRPKFL